MRDELAQDDGATNSHLVSKVPEGDTKVGVMLFQSVNHSSRGGSSPEHAPAKDRINVKGKGETKSTGSITNYRALNRIAKTT